MRFQKTIAAFVATVGVSSSALGGNTDNFPRLGGIWNGGAQQYDSGFQTYAAKYHIVIIGTNYAAWEAVTGYSKQTVISSIKAQSAVGTRVFMFGPSLDQMSNTPGGGADPILTNQWIARNWYLYVSGSGGSVVNGDAWPETNSTSAVPNDPATGLSPYGWGAKYANDTYHLGLNHSINGTSACPSLDGFMIDNVFWRPRTDGDWLRNGTTQSQNDPTTQFNFRAGQKAYYDEMARVWPSGVFFGNIADWYGGNGANSVVPLGGVLGGGFFEGAIGNSYSTETFGGSALMQQQYQFQINNLKAPKYLIFEHNFVTASGSDPYGPNWQAMRYGITAALMNNGYYNANIGQTEDDLANRLWFDEYDGGGLGVGYLGQPLSSAAGATQTAAWSKGVWKREFSNGIVLWNPKGNGTQSVSLSGLGTLKHFSGSQNPSLNDGSTVTNGSVTLQDRDGLILVRLTPVKIPNPPTSVKIQ